MPYILTYTKKDDIYSTLVDRPKNMSGHIYFSDVYEAMHLALSWDGEHFTPLRNNTGILFPKATFTEGKPEGTTKTLRYPWLFDRADGTYGVCAVRRNEDGPDPLSIGCVMFFSSKDLIRYEETGFLKVADEEISSPRCRYKEARGEYSLEFGTSQGIFRAYTADFSEVHGVEKISGYTLKTAEVRNILCDDSEFQTVTDICVFSGQGKENDRDVFAEPETGAEGVSLKDVWPGEKKKSGAGNRDERADGAGNRGEKADGAGNRDEERKREAGNRGEMQDILCGNVLEISEEAAEKMEKYLGVIRHVSVDPVIWEVSAESVNGGKVPSKTEKSRFPETTDEARGHSRNETGGVQNGPEGAQGGRSAILCMENLPRAVCRYSDGSAHEKPVDWDETALKAIDLTKPGTYEVPGRIRQKHWPFPVMKEGISDPCITRYQGKYYLSATGMREVSFRISDTIEGCFKAPRTVVWSLPRGDRKHANIWAQELHIIHDVPYVFTTVANPEWYTVRSHVLRCSGDIADRKAWEEPRLCVKTDGTPLEEHGISLDMTYFCVENVHYVMWSNRVVHVNEPEYMPDADTAEEKSDRKDGSSAEKKNGLLKEDFENKRKAGNKDASVTEGFESNRKKKKKENAVVCEPADIFIATIDPDAPWQLTSDPVRVLRPQYGWDRLNTEVDEGPYLLRHGDDLFVTISGSSTGVADLYCLGLLHAREGDDLLRPESWDWLPYPVLTKESVPGEFGPGHNNFVKDGETGDDLMVYHAVPHDKNGKSLGRHAGIRRVHWAANGYPYLEMTEERDLDPALRDITMKVAVL